MVEDFKYLTPKLRLEPYMLCEPQVLSRTFHMICSSDRCINMVQQILERRELLLQDYAPASSTRPVFVWEPVPDRCTPEEQQRFFIACRLVDVVSPNSLELGMMFGRLGWNEENIGDQELVRKILRSGIGPDCDGTLVIRAGKDGSYSYSRNRKGLWLPAYHQPDSSKSSPPVVDPTGAGNSFLGALALGLVSEGRSPIQVIESILESSDTWNTIVREWGGNGQVPKALICATVAAGFMVEQISVPQLSPSMEEELWNGTSFTERVHLYTQRLHKTLDETSQTRSWLIG
jgi:sugar/nucleoside kinase (ribokinase family)